MKLYKLEASGNETFFGTMENPIARDVTIIAQTPSCDAFLLLSKDTQDSLELLNLLHIPQLIQFIKNSGF